MLSYIGMRILQSIPVLFIVSLLTFSILFLLPGDPVELMLIEVGADKATMESLREQLGLNDPFHVQYGRFLFKALQGDFGRSIRSKRPVVDTIMSQLPATIQLTVAAMGIAVVFGVLFGTIAALRHNTWIDNAVMTTAVSRRRTRPPSSKRRSKYSETVSAPSRALSRRNGCATSSQLSQLPASRPTPIQT